MIIHAIASFLPLSLAIPVVMAASTPLAWLSPPTITLDECSQTDEAIAPSPFSNRTDEYVLVFSYLASTPRENQLHSMVLVISFRNMSSTEGVVNAQVLLVTSKVSSSNQTLNWIISDSDGNGEVDSGRLIFREEVSNHLTVDEIDAPIERLEDLKAYFDEASDKLNESASKEPTPECRRR